MKKRLRSGWQGLALALLIQLACKMGNLPAQYEFEMGGVERGRGTYSQIEKINRRVGLPLFHLEEGMG